MTTPHIRLAVHKIEDDYDEGYRLCVLLRLEDGWDVIVEKSEARVEDLDGDDVSDGLQTAARVAVLLGLPVEIDPTVDELSLAIANGETHDPEAAEDVRALNAALAKADDFLAGVLGQA